MTVRIQLLAGLVVRHRLAIAFALAGVALLAWLLGSDDLNGLLGGGASS